MKKKLINYFIILKYDKIKLILFFGKAKKEAKLNKTSTHHTVSYTILSKHDSNPRWRLIVSHEITPLIKTILSYFS